MNDITGMISFIIMAIVATTVIAVIVYIIVIAIKNKDLKDSKLDFPKQFFFQIYLYLISLLTIILAVAGGVSAIRGAISYRSIPFSYTLYKANSFEEMKTYDTSLTEDTFEACSDGEIINMGKNDYCFNYSNQSTDIIMGVTVFILMVVIFGIHQFALSKVKNKVSWLEKFYTFSSLVIYSAASLISIPISIYQLSNFLMTNTSQYGYTTPQAPVIALGIVLFVLPIWIYFLVRVSKSKNID